MKGETTQENKCVCIYKRSLVLRKPGFPFFLNCRLASWLKTPARHRLGFQQLHFLAIRFAAGALFCEVFY